MGRPLVREVEEGHWEPSLLNGFSGSLPDVMAPSIPEVPGAVDSETLGNSMGI